MYTAYVHGVYKRICVYMRIHICVCMYVYMYMQRVQMYICECRCMCVYVRCGRSDRPGIKSYAQRRSGARGKHHREDEGRRAGSP